MPFHTLSFLLFLPIVFIIHALVGNRLRALVLPTASLVFYAALGSPLLLLALGTVTGISYCTGLFLSARVFAPGRRTVFWLGAVATLSILFSFKFLPIILGITPFVSVGVSFFVFQAISYMADVYLEVLEAERRPVRLLSSLAFFPKLLQGPIERTGDLLPQLARSWHFDYDIARSCLLRFAFGLFKKIVIADRLSVYVDAVYGDPTSHSGLTLLFATYAYALQIYFDFSGYTDMALGTAGLFGVRLTENFDRPYTATSVADFWRRWHISFSRWILDYIFKPLQICWRDEGRLGTAFALLVTFLLSGIWHGASWGFLIWGLLHGLYLSASIFWQPFQRRIHRSLRLEGSWLLTQWRRLVTFHLVCFAWVFFRASSLRDALHILKGFFTSGGPSVIRDVAFQSSTPPLIALAMAIALFLNYVLSGERPRVLTWPFLWRWSTYLFIGYSLFYLFLPSDRFIYLGF